MTADVMNAYDPVGEDENARLQLYFTCASYAAAADCLMDMREREDSFASDFDSAAGGDAIGMLRLGHRLYYGRGVECDRVQAAMWYQRAANSGSDAAMLCLARLAEEERRDREAARWYRRYAADRIHWRNRRLNW